MRALMGFDADISTTPGGTKCAPVTFTPGAGTVPIVVTLSTTQEGGHIFYRVTKITSSVTEGKPPVHVDDSAVSPTIRIGTTHGSVSLTSGFNIVMAVCYVPGLLDSDITEAEYDTGI